MDAAPLELGGRRQHVGVRQPLLAEDVHLLDAFGVVELAHHLGQAAVDGLDDLGLGGQVLQIGELDALVGRPHRRDLRVERHQGGHEGSVVTDGRGLRHQGDQLEGRLQVGGADVLAARGDDQLLLAVDDAQVAVLVDLADVARVQPAVLVDRLGGLLRVVQVALADQTTPAADLAVREDLELHTRQRAADGAGLDLEPLEGHGPGVLAHPVDLGERDADRAEPGDQLRRDGCGTGHRHLALVQADQGADRAERHVVEELVGRDLLIGRGAPGHLLSDGRRRRDGLVELLGLLRVGGQRSGDTGVELLPHTRHPEDDVRVHLPQEGGEHGGLGAGRHLDAAAQQHVVRDHPLGDVRHRQVRHDLLAGEVLTGPAVDGQERLHRPHDVVVGEHHALGAPGGARGVDDRRQIVRRADRRCLDQVQRLRVGQRTVADDTLGQLGRCHERHDRVELGQLVTDLEELRQEGVVLDDRHLGRAVAGQVGDLVRRRGVVDGDRGRAEEQHREVQVVELRDVAHHQHDAVPGDDPELTKAGRGPSGAVRHLREGHRVPRVLAGHPAQGRTVRVGGERGQELRGDRPTGHHLVDLVLRERRHRSP